MTDSTNPRILADNISALQTTVISQGNAIEALGSYSTTEIDTGKTWIDGSKIYRIVLTFEEAIEISYNGYSTLTTDIPIALILEGRGIYDATKAVFSVFGYNDAGTLKLQTERNGYPIQINKLFARISNSSTLLIINSPSSRFSGTV